MELQILRDVSQRYQHQQKHSAQDQAGKILTIVEQYAGLKLLLENLLKFRDFIHFFCLFVGNKHK